MDPRSHASASGRTVRLPFLPVDLSEGWGIYRKVRAKYKLGGKRQLCLH